MAILFILPSNCSFCTVLNTGKFAAPLIFVLVKLVSVITTPERSVFISDAPEKETPDSVAPVNIAPEKSTPA